MGRRVRWWLAAGLTALLALQAAALLSDPPLSLVFAASGLLALMNCGALYASGGAARKVEALFARQDQLMLAIEHEIGSPLGHALAILDGLREEVPSGQVVSDAADSVVDLSQVIEDVLAMARIMCGTLDLPRDEMRLDEVARGLPGVSQGVRSDLRFDSSPTVAWGSPHLMRRAISNLVRNAASHGYSGPGSAIVIRVDELGVSVQDDGPGIPPARLSKVCRADGLLAPRGRRQTGLGLPLARWVAHVHGGRLVLSNRPEGGFEAHLQVHAMALPPSSSSEDA